MPKILFVAQSCNGWKSDNYKRRYEEKKQRTETKCCCNIVTENKVFTQRKYYWLPKIAIVGKVITIIGGMKKRSKELTQSVVTKKKMYTQQKYHMCPKNVCKFVHSQFVIATLDFSLLLTIKLMLF